MTACLKLRQIFKNDNDFAWRILEAQCQIYTKRSIKIQDVTSISQLYMKAVERLNSLQDQRQKYFSQKMLKLMAQPYVIRCFNEGNRLNQQKNREMQFKRKEIQQIISHENQKTNPARLKHIIDQYGQKQKKLTLKIDKIMHDHEKALQQRLKKRTSLKPDRLSYIESVDRQSLGKQKQHDKIWGNVQNLNPEKSRKTSSSQIIQIDSP